MAGRWWCSLLITVLLVAAVSPDGAVEPNEQDSVNNANSGKSIGADQKGNVEELVNSQPNSQHLADNPQTESKEKAKIQGETNSNVVNTQNGGPPGALKSNVESPPGVTQKEEPAVEKNRKQPETEKPQKEKDEDKIHNEAKPNLDKDQPGGKITQPAVENPPDEGHSGVPKTQEKQPGSNKSKKEDKDEDNIHKEVKSNKEKTLGESQTEEQKKKEGEPLGGDKATSATVPPVGDKATSVKLPPGGDKTTQDKVPLVGDKVTSEKLPPGGDKTTPEKSPSGGDKATPGKSPPGGEKATPGKLPPGGGKATPGKLPPGGDKATPEKLPSEENNSQNNEQTEGKGNLNGQEVEDVESKDDEDDNAKLGDGDSFTADNEVDNNLDNEEQGQEEKSPSGNKEENTALQEESESSHFFAYLVTSAILVAVLYIAYHNKRKIIAFALEGRRSKNGRRPNSGEYQRLDHKI